MGSDTFRIGGDVTGRVVASDVEGRSGLITHGVTSADGAYDNLLIDGIPVSIADESRGSVTIDQDGGTRILEGGHVASYSLGLSLPNDMSIADGTMVTLTVSAAMSSTKDRTRAQEGKKPQTVMLSKEECDEFTNALTVDFVFDSQNGWGSDQEIFIKAPKDGVIEGTRNIAVSHLASVTMPDDEPIPEALSQINDQAIANAMITVFDSDQGDLFIEQTGRRLTVIEGENGTEQSDSFFFSLTTPPAADETVTVSLAFDDRLAVDEDTFTFTADNWQERQEVTVSVVNSDTVSNRLDTRINFDITSNQSDSLYQNIQPGSVLVSAYDNNSADVVVQEVGDGTRINASGGTDAYTLRLTKAPTDNVLVRLNSDGFSNFDVDNERVVLDTIVEESIQVDVLDPVESGPRLVLQDGRTWSSLDVSVGMILTTEDDQQFKVNNLSSDGTALNLTTSANGITQDTLTINRISTPAVVFTADDWFEQFTVEISLDENYIAAAGSENDRQFQPQDNVLDRIQGPLILEGGTGDTDRSIAEAVMLPYEDDGERDEFVIITPQEAAKQDTNTLIMSADASSADLEGTLTNNHVAGLGMSPADADPE
ncbi:hypothetical protein HLB35_14725 [Halomonas sp. TBZ9]|uniref:Uncharacterized protein n=1 Tax=Vreelandella azerica TaxID=2732867 RepID=A0A7Y3XBT8_9GAMM|nr:hypothetical protein [Halomonas azerica]NOG32699.1 hypothetical protein [Halomonas azerica]